MTIMAQRRVDLKELWVNNPRPRRDTGRESIHSGHFMISDFEAEAQDDEDELAVPVPEVAEPKAVIPCRKAITSIQTSFCPTDPSKVTCNLLSIETSLTKLFQCMSIAYRQKLTSPKWNRFKGVRLRWKDKIRLNNVIWRCWHMQFINKQNTLVCQFASPLDVDTHNKPEAIVLEGKYWKRKLHAVTAEYKKWRMFTYNQILGKSGKMGHDLLSEFESPDWQGQACEQMLVDEDYMSLMSDTLFSAISGPFPFPDTRELARGTNLADFIQPSLVQLQPSLDEIMDIEPLNDLLCTKLTSVSEEMGGGYGKGGRELSYPQQDAPSYPVWYIPPYSQPPHQSAQQQLFPPPPPPPPASPQPSAKPKLKHRVPAAKSSVNKKLAPTRPSDTSPPSLNQPSLSSQPQNSALLEQLLSTTANNLYNFLEPSTDPSNVSKMNSPGSSLQTNQSVEGPYLSSPYEQLDNAQLLYQRSKQSNIISNPDLSYGVSPENSCMPPSPASSENSSPTKVSLLSPITPPPLSSKGGAINSCPESPAGSQDQLTLSPLNVGSPSSPKSVPAYKEHRRVCHINAEQKRRCNIKNGFDTLHSLIPQLTQNPNAKMSKAAMLQKGADYIVQLRNERSSLKQEMESLKQQIESLNSTICNCQSMLPVTGAPISRHRSNRMKDMFRQYIRSRTHENWKFWILSLIFEPLLESFNNNVSTNSLEDLYQTTLQWVDQHCTLIDLRPVVLNALRQLCTTTEVLSDPARLPSEARAAVDKSSKKSSSHSHH